MGELLVIDPENEWRSKLKMPYRLARSARAMVPQLREFENVDEETGAIVVTSADLGVGLGGGGAAASSDEATGAPAAPAARHTPIDSQGYAIPRGPMSLIHKEQQVCRFGSTPPQDTHAHTSPI